MTKRKATESVPAKVAPRDGIAAALVGIDDETRDVLRDSIGTKNLHFNVNLFVRTAKTAFVFQGDGVDPVAEDQVSQTAVLVAIKAFKPTNPVEAMLASQAVMLHNLAMETGRRSQLPNQHPDVASRMRRDAANLSRSMVEMTEALERRRGRGPQVIRVEKMLVADGGQAVVGNVTAGAPLPASASIPRTIGRSEASMPMVETVPVEAGEGEGR